MYIHRCTHEFLTWLWCAKRLGDPGILDHFKLYKTIPGIYNQKEKNHNISCINHKSPMLHTDKIVRPRPMATLEVVGTRFLLPCSHCISHSYLAWNVFVSPLLGYMHSITATSFIPWHELGIWLWQLENDPIRDCCLTQRRVTESISRLRGRSE